MTLPQPNGPRAGHDVIVVGASAGGVEALMNLVRSLPADLPAAICIVLHLSPNSPSLLPQLLERAGTLPAMHPGSGQPLTHGQIYVAPPDYHLLVRQGHVELSHGPRENRSRPSIDVLFRSAAEAYGPRVVAVVLSGTLDDGVAGMRVVKARGGVGLVQDPAEALFGSMPQHVIDAVTVDQMLPVDKLSKRLMQLSREPAEAAHPGPAEATEEVAMAESDLSLMTAAEQPGTPSVFGCPDCGGVLWELHDDQLVHYRCRVGHAFSPDALLEAQAQGVEDALWAALRALEEQADLVRRLETRAREANRLQMADRYAERRQRAEANAAKLRQLLWHGVNRDVPAASAKR